MEKIKKIWLIQSGLAGLYLLTLYTPIYSQSLFGTVYKVSIAQLVAGTVFVLLFILGLIATIVTVSLKSHYSKYVLLSTIGYMTLLAVILGLFKDDLSKLRLTWYIQIVLIIILWVSYFKEELVVKVFESIVNKIKELIQTFSRRIKTKFDERKQTKGLEQEEERVQ